MVIQKSKKDLAEPKSVPTPPKASMDDRIITPRETSIDGGSTEAPLRPTSLDEYVGQSQIKSHLSVSIASARIRKTPLEHILLYGPPGLGKTTLANILAFEMSAHLKTTSGPAIDKPADLVSLLTGLEEGDMLFIDEIHRLKPQLEEILYSAMEDFAIDIMVGAGTGATSVRMDIPKFTLIGATTKLSKLTGPLRDRFGNVFKLDFYDLSDLSSIVRRSFRILGSLDASSGTAELVAKKSRGTPRIANRFVKILRDYSVIGESIEDAENCERIFAALGVDELGLDNLDRKLLNALVHNFAGAPVGLGTLASIVGEEEDTIEDVVEPYLLQIGFLERTPRGRKITMAGENWVRGMK